MTVTASPVRRKTLSREPSLRLAWQHRSCGGPFSTMLAQINAQKWQPWAQDFSSWWTDG
jgi:hypothetical protein